MRSVAVFCVYVCVCFLFFFGGGGGGKGVSFFLSGSSRPIHVQTRGNPSKISYLRAFKFSNKLRLNVFVFVCLFKKQTNKQTKKQQTKFYRILSWPVFIIWFKCFYCVIIIWRELIYYYAGQFAQRTF